MRPEEAGSGAAAHRWAKDASETSLSGVVPGGDQQLPGGLGPNAWQREQAGGSAGDQNVQIGIRVCYLFAQVPVALGQRCRPMVSMTAAWWKSGWCRSRRSPRWAVPWWPGCSFRAQGMGSRAPARRTDTTVMRLSWTSTKSTGRSPGEAAVVDTADSKISDRVKLRPAKIQGYQKTLGLASSHTSLTNESAREHARASDLDNRCRYGPRRTRWTLHRLGSMAYEIPVTQARAELAELINRVVYGGERVVVTRHGKPLVALVSAADLERLENGGVADEEQVISSVSSIGSSVSAPGERRRFGIAAEHRGHSEPGA